MKDYKVEVIVNFTDKKEKKDRVIGDVFECTKERYEYLSGGNEKGKEVVKLIEVKTTENKEQGKKGKKKSDE